MARGVRCHLSGLVVLRTVSDGSQNREMSFSGEGCEMSFRFLEVILHTIGVLWNRPGDF